MMGYSPQGMAPQQSYVPMMAPGMQAPGMAYPPSPMGGAPMMPPPGGMGMGMGMPGQQAFNGEDPYAYAQQYGLTRGEVDGALEAYTELSNTDRGLLSAFGAGSAQKVLQKVFGSAGNEQMVAMLIGVLGSALASGRVRTLQLLLALHPIPTSLFLCWQMPTIKDFISMMGQYKMVCFPLLYELMATFIGWCGFLPYLGWWCAFILTTELDGPVLCGQDHGQWRQPHGRSVPRHGTDGDGLQPDAHRWHEPYDGRRRRPRRNDEQPSGRRSRRARGKARKEGQEGQKEEEEVILCQPRTLCHDCEE